MVPRIAYMGIPFSNSEEAAVKFAAKQGWKEYELVPCMSAEGVMNALDNDKGDYGVLATENVTAGPVIETRVALEGRDDVQILDTQTVHIYHCIFTRGPECKIDTVSSHIQALMQCKGNLEILYPGVKQQEVEDTAYAAEMLSKGMLTPNVAVICRENAGRFYGLYPAHLNIEDRKDNATSFSLIKLCRSCT